MPERTCTPPAFDARFVPCLTKRPRGVGYQWLPGDMDTRKGKEMLSLGMKAGERIQITGPDDKPWWLIVSEIHQGRVRLLFDAPSEVQIIREKALLKREEKS